MRAAVRVGNRVSKAENLIGIAVVVLHHAIDKDFILLPSQNDWPRMNDLFVLAELFNEFLDSFPVEEPFLLVLDPLIGEQNLHARIEKCQFTEAVGQNVKFEFGRDRKNRRVWLERDQGTGLFGFADNSQLFRGDTPGKGHVIDLPVARDLHLEPV